MLQTALRVRLPPWVSMGVGDLRSSLYMGVLLMMGVSSGPCKPPGGEAGEWRADPNCASAQVVAYRPTPLLQQTRSEHVLGDSVSLPGPGVRLSSSTHTTASR